LATLDSGVPSDEAIVFCRLYLLARHAAEQPDATQEQQARLERIEENFERAFSPIRESWEAFTDLSSAEREDGTILAEYADTIRTYRAVDRMLSGDYDCTCAQRCTEGEHSADCLRCVIDGIEGCTGEAPRPLMLGSKSVQAAWGVAGDDGALPSDWAGSGTLVDAVAYANGLGSGTAYIQLQSGEIYITDTLTIDAGKKAVLDLNGNNILAELLNEFFTILTVDGTLTLKDTSSDDVTTQGKLLGLTSDDAIGVYVRDGGNFTMEAGSITNRNPNNKGRGVKVVKGTFTMTGGSITGNTVTGVAGGGVWVENGTFNLSDGSISKNTAGAGGGGVVLWGSTFTMTGGSITNNSANMAAAKANGGGVQNNWSTFVMTGGEISGNNAGTSGGGINGDGLTVGGTAKITGNTSGDSAIVSNIWLNANDSSKILTVSSETPLESGASFGISMERLAPITTEKPANITGANTANISAYFFSDNDAYGIQNGTGNIVQLVTAPSYEAAWGVAKSNGSAPESWANTGKLTEAVAFANALSGGTAYIRLFGDADTSEALFIQPNQTAILDLNGHTIDAKQGAFSVILVGGALTLHDTSAGGTGKITGGNAPYTGGGVLVRNGGNLTMTGGTITGNAATYDGGGVDLQSGASFTMTGGKISGNTAAAGGGVFAKPQSTFTMTGGEISGNTATEGVGGVYVEGVYDEFAATQMTVGGTAKITGNQCKMADSTIVSNVQLASTAILTVSSSVPLAEGASISVRKSLASGATTADITGTNSSDVSGYFASDSDKRSIQNGTGNIVQLVAAPTYEAQWREQNDSTWTSGTLAEAVNFANTLPEGYYGKVAIIKLLSDVTTTQTLEFAERNTTTELDLNGKTIDANGGTFPVLTVHQKFILSDNSTTDVTKQGKITGSNNAGDGGGISVNVLRAGYDPVFIMKGGNITGNTAENGGGIDVRGGYEVTLNGGNISGNTALRNGGGLFLSNCNSTMNAGTISDNTAQNGSGAYINFCNFTMHGGRISGNAASVSGGGVYFDYYMGSFTMDDGDITGNTARINGGGLNLVGYSFIGGTANISGNHKTANAATTDNNLYLAFGEPLHISPAPQEGFAVGVNLLHKPTKDQPSSVTTTRYVYDTDISGYFSSDDSAYETRYDANNKVVQLIVGAEARWGEAKADGSAPDSGWIRGSFTEAAAYANAMESGKKAYIQVLNDVTGNQVINENKTTILDLNGKTITGVSDWTISTLTVYGNLTLIDTSTNVVANQGKIINRSCGVGVSSGKVTMKGGQITGVNASHGRGVFVGTKSYNSDWGTFTMEGGAITNNTASDGAGSGVYVEYGAFIMTGGAITNNTASDGVGGGVYVKNATFTMTGGNISGNTANEGGGGVSLDDRGWMWVGGTANISGNNKTAGTPSSSINNVYLNFESAILVSTDTPLADGASISVSVSAYKKPTASKPFKITTTNTSNVSNYFHSDDSNYSIENGTDNVVQLGLGSSTSGPPVITTTSLSNGVVGTAYSQTLEARGQTPITWSILSGTLPAGLSLNSTTGVISGTPTTAGVSAFTIKATNSLGNDSKLLAITVTSPITSVSVSPATATVKKTKTQQFTANVTATDGTAKTVTWSVSGGTASSISTDGLLTVGGRETATTLTVKATATADSNKFGTATVTVAAAPNIYTVTFDSDGGSAVAAVGNVEEGSAIKIPNSPTKENHRFDGWYTGKNGSGKQFTAATAVTASMTVYAKWTKLVTVSGIVVEEEGEAPVSGATVTLSPTYGTTAVTTTADGKFSFANIPEEYLTVTAVFTDGSSMTVNVTDNHANIKIVKPKPYITITGQPKDAYLIKGIAGQSAVFRVECARVPHIPDVIACEWWWLKGNTPSGMAPDEKMSGSGNQMTFNASNGNIPDRGSYKLYSLAYTVDDVLLDTYSRVATLKVVGTNTIEGVVKKTDGALVSGATVKLEYADGAWPYGNVAITSSEVTQTTAADGVYKFELVPDGKYKLIITLPGGGEITYGPYDFPGPKPGPNPIDPGIIIPDKAEIRVSGQPQDATVKNGTAVTLAVNASATDSTALTYQWYKSAKNSTGSGTAITGATTNTYTPSTAEKGTAYYYCVVSGGSLTPVTTRPAKVTVFTYGIIAGTVQTTSKQPIEGAVVELINIDTPVKTDFTTSTNPQTTLADGKYKFIEVPDGTYKLKITLPGTDGPVFVVEPINAPNVNPDIPVTPPDKPTIRITKQPASKIVALNDTAEFAVNAGVSNDGVVLYQWYSNTTNSTTGGTPIYGATENTFRAPTSTKGVAYYYCVMQASGADNVTSSIAKLTVRNTPLTNLMTIEGDVVDNDGNKVENAIVTLSPRAGTSENPQTTKADGHYKFENLPDGQYTITIKLPGGGVITEEIIIIDGEITPTPPNNIEVPTSNSITIIQQPKSIEATTDMTASFTAKATATKADVTYQWYKNTTASNSGGTKLDDKTNATLELGKQPEGVSYYYCVISSTGATDVMTNPAMLTVTKATGGKGDLEGGIVEDENGDPVADATVKLMKNGTDGIQFGSTVTTGKDGKFQFTAIPYGSYSLVAQKDTSTVTRQITIKTASNTENLIMPSGAKITKVIIEGNTPSTAVENLEEMFTGADNTIAQQPGAVVEIKLVVKKEDAPSDKDDIDAALTDNQEVGIYLDAKLIKVISGTVTGDGTENIQPLSGQTLRMVIDLPESLWNKAPYQIIRSHTENGVTDVRIITPDYDRELQTLSFDADAFSTYAIVYTQAPKYSVTVIGSQAGSSSGTGLYEAGATVTVQAGSKSGYTFNGWTTVDGVSFASAEKATTSFTMPTKNITVTANWKSSGGGGGNSGGDDDDDNNGGGNSTPGGGTNTPGGGTSNPGGGTNTPGGGTNTSGGGTSNPSGGNNNGATGETAPENGSGSAKTEDSSDLNNARDNALKQIADERQKAIDALPYSLTDVQRQKALDHIDRIYTKAVKDIQNLESTSAITDVTDQTVRDLANVVTGAGGEMPTQAPSGKEKSFVLLSAALAAASLLGTLLTWRRREDEEMDDGNRRRIATATAVAAILMFLMTTGWHGFIFANWWTVAVAVPTAVSLLCALRHK
jgi:uncharacterized repeat protein (TIGR02543 family)